MGQTETNSCGLSISVSRPESGILAQAVIRWTETTAIGVKLQSRLYATKSSPCMSVCLDSRRIIEQKRLVSTKATPLVALVGWLASYLGDFRRASAPRSSVSMAIVLGSHDVSPATDDRQHEAPPVLAGRHPSTDDVRPPLPLLYIYIYLYI